MAQMQHETPAPITAISAHPAFPFLVALWFAALFGLGMLVLPTAVLERLVAASHIGALLLAASPPLGFTARVMMALLASGLGAAAGHWLARKVAGFRNGAERNQDTDTMSGAAMPHGELAETDGAGAKARRPLFASTDLGLADSPVDEPNVPAWLQGKEAPARSRRPLALPESPGPHADFDPYTVPLPGEGPADEPAWASMVPPAFEDSPTETGPSSFSSTADTALPASPVPVGFAAEAEAPHATVLEEIRKANPADLGIVALVERLRLALEARVQAEAASARPVTTSGTGLETGTVRGTDGAAAIAAIASAPIAADGGLQSFFAQTNPAPPAPASAPDALFPAQWAVEPVSMDDHSDPQDEAWNPLCHFPQLGGLHALSPYESGPLDEDDEAEPLQYDAEGDSGHDTFGSLLDMPGTNGLARDETAEAELTGNDPDETERVLRDALATLRQISGAA